jgi:hypothetical protein
MSKVVKIVVQKDDKSFIEYTIDNGTIVDVSVIEKETTLEEKVKNLKENNEQVKTISKLIQFDKAGVLDKMAQNGSDSVFDTIKEDVVNNPIQESVVKEINEVSDSINKDKLTQGVKDAANIMKLDEQMDEFAKKNRKKIAEHLFDENANNADARPILETIIENSKYSINKENLTVPDDLDREEAKDNYEVTNAKNKVITDKNYKSYLGDIPSDYSRDISLKKGVEEVNGIDKALKIPDRSERIAYLKDIISKINTKDE